jgi:hypothetical protein
MEKCRKKKEARKEEIDWIAGDLVRGLGVDG